MRLILAILLAIVPLAASAQQDERLPDLTPQEFEIRGDLQVSLPDLERQPLRGFTPPPRTYVEPADRQPFVAPYAQRLDDLPADPLAAAPTPSLLGVSPRIGQIDLMAGRHLGRRGRLTVATGGFGLDVRYHGYSEYEWEPDALTQADNLAGRASFTTTGPISFSLEVDGAYHEYGLLAAYQIPDIPDAPPGPTARQMQAVGFSGRLVGDLPVAPFSLGVRFGSARIDDPGSLVFTSFFPQRKTSLSESSLRIDGTVAPGPATIEGSVGLLGLDEAGLGESLVDFDAGVLVDVPLGAAGLRVGLQVFGFDSADDEVLSELSGVRVGPRIELSMPMSETTRLYAWNRSGLTTRGLQRLAELNPYVSPAVRLAPDVHVVNAEAGLDVRLDLARAKAYAGYRSSPAALYFERPAASDGFPALYAPAYDPMATLRGGGSLTIYGPANTSASAGLEWRSARLTDQDRAVPFVAPIGWQLSVAVPFAHDRGLLQMALRGEGSRPTDESDETADGWADVSVEAHYRFAGRFGLVGRVDHLGVRAEQWPGFPQPSSIVMAGIRAGW